MKALFIAKLAKEAINNGFKINQFAIITPYRRQVKAIREAVINAIGVTCNSHLPLIDTVERLQGQDVDMIVLSTSITDPTYFSSQRDFILNLNRLNVMISRAKMKVVILSRYCDFDAIKFYATVPYMRFYDYDGGDDFSIDIEDFLDAIYDGGQYCAHEMKLAYLGFISGAYSRYSPFVIEFGNDYVQLQAMGEIDNAVYEELIDRITHFTNRLPYFNSSLPISFVLENIGNGGFILKLKP